MIKTRHQLAAEALKLSLKVRLKNDIKITDTFCVYDLAEKIGIEVKFVDIPSLEGMYIGRPKETIIISSHRPPGRQRFTCAHELGHHFYKHGKHIDEIISNKQENKKDLQEVIADSFASYLLMPSSTVINGFVRRGWDINTTTPVQVYKISCWLGVGYTTLINHICYGINKISQESAANLLAFTPKTIKEEILGNICQENVFVVDEYWSGRPVDLSSGDYVVFSKDINVDCSRLEEKGVVNGNAIYMAKGSGIGKAYHSKSEWATFIRISNSNYNGRGKFRHLEDE